MSYVYQLVHASQVPIRTHVEALCGIKDGVRDSGLDAKPRIQWMTLLPLADPKQQKYSGPDYLVLKERVYGQVHRDDALLDKPPIFMNRSMDAALAYKVARHEVAHLRQYHLALRGLYRNADWEVGAHAFADGGRLLSAAEESVLDDAHFEALRQKVAAKLAAKVKTATVRRSGQGIALEQLKAQHTDTERQIAQHKRSGTQQDRWIAQQLQHHLDYLEMIITAVENGYLELASNTLPSMAA